MSGAKEIRTQINSIGSTRKITKAMEMVAASKMRRALEREATVVGFIIIAQNEMPMKRRRTCPVRGALRAGACAALLALSGNAAALDKGVSLAARGGTLGGGLEMKFPLHSKFNARLVANRFNKTDDKERKGNRYRGDLNLRTFGAIGDWHPDGGGFRVSIGVFSNGSELKAKTTGDSFTFNGRKYTGEANLLLDFESAAPYLGIGWGSQKPSGLSLDFEIGLLYQNTPQLSAHGSGGVGPGSSCNFTVNDKGIATVSDVCGGLKTDLEAEHKDLQDDIDDFKVYPVLSFGLQYRF
ncbi:MAG: hypothetical protein OD817_04680 [Gammaproteobacteria bacterium]